MERIESINVERILWCCEDRGIAVEDLASAVGIAASTLDKVIEGERGLTFNQLRKLAKYFNRGVLFFLEPGEVDESKVRTPEFRTIANQRPDLTPELKALIERAEQHRDLYLSLVEDLDEEDYPRFEPPEVPRNHPGRAAAMARDWLGLGEQNDFDSYRAAVEAKGILVFQSMGYAGAWQIPKESPVAGFSIYHQDAPVIVVRKYDVKARQSFTLMHELAHVLIHQSSFIDDEEDLYSHSGRERVANAFAGRVLVPASFLRRIPLQQRPRDVTELEEWLRPFRNEWGVSAEVILRRLMDTNHLEQEVYESYRQWRAQLRPPEPMEGGSRAYRHREPRHIFGDRFVRTVLDALHAREISLNKASSYLDNLKVKDVHRLEEWYAGA